MKLAILMGVALGLSVMVMGVQAQLLCWALPLFHLRNIGLGGPFLLTLFLDTIMGVSIASRRQR